MFRIEGIRAVIILINEKGALPRCSSTLEAARSSRNMQWLRKHARLVPRGGVRGRGGRAAKCDWLRQTLRRDNERDGVRYAPHRSTPCGFITANLIIKILKGPPGKAGPRF